MSRITSREFVRSIAEECRRLGVDAERLTPAKITRVLLEEFGIEFTNEPLDEVVPVVTRWLRDAK